MATKESTVIDDKIYINIIYINNEFMKYLYDYDINDDIQDQIGDIKEEFKEYFAILDIVRKFYILSRLKDDETDASVSTKNKINENKFEQLPLDILEALKKKTENLKAILEKYLKNKKSNNSNGALKVEEDDDYGDTLQTLRTTLEQLQRDVARYISLFFSTNKITKGRTDASFKFETPPASVAKEDALKNLNALYIELSDNILDKFNKIRSKYEKKDTKYNLVDIEEDLNTLLKLNETLNKIYESKNEDINNYIKIIDPERDKDGGITQTKLTAVELNPIDPIDVGWGMPPVSSSAGPSVRSMVANIEKREQKAGNPAKYKSTGQVVYIMYKNKKYKRVIYVKDKRNTRYCKINKEYILLSKLKVIQ